MKKIVFLLATALTAAGAFAQTPQGRIVLAKGQKIQATLTISTEANLSPGMDVQNNSSSEVVLEVKEITGNNTVISNTIQKLKVDMDMAGKAASYDSEKPEDKDTDFGRLFSSTINTPVDITLDITTGKVIEEKKVETKKEGDAANPMGGLMEMFGANSNEDLASGAFMLVPAGKKAGDSWNDSLNTKTSKTVRTYTLRSVTGSEALLQVNTTVDATSDTEMQGMQMTIVTTSKTTGDITTDLSTGLVKKKNIVTEITGNLQVMGQEVPINSRTTLTVVYK